MTEIAWKQGRRAMLIGLGAASLVVLQGRVGAAATTPAKTPAPAATPYRSNDHVYDRSIHFVYARSGGKALPKYSDDQLISFFDQVPGGLTSIVPFFLNVPDASAYAPMLAKMKAKGIVIVPGIGQKPGDGPINVKKYKDMAKNYRPYTDYIRLENTQGYYDAHGAAPIQDLIDYCVSLGFKHIMLNPWPNAKGGEVVPFKNPELDSTIYQVLLKQDRKNHRPLPSAEAWFPGNPNKIDAVRRYRPSIQILINYESAPQHEVLAQMEKDKKGSSIPAMNITATKIEQSNKNLHWSPPFTSIYDPVALGTWPWMAKRLGDFK